MDAETVIYKELLPGVNGHKHTFHDNMLVQGTHEISKQMIKTIQ